jgi:hypothetical protein
MMNRHQRRQAERARKAMPGYKQRLVTAAPDLATMPGVSQAMILHDDACAIFQRRPCTCVPDISIIPATGGSVLVIDAHGQTHRTKRQ